jgi:methyl-accepting chemotaxis protein
VSATERSPRTGRDGAIPVALPLRWAIVVVGWSGVAAGALATALPGRAAFLIALGVAGATVVLVAGAIAGPAERLAAGAETAARGDLSRPIEPGGPSEILRAAHHLEAIRRAHRDALSELSRGAAQLGQESAALRDGLARQAAVATRQAAAVTETSTTASEIAQTAKAAALHAEEVIQVAQRSEDLSSEGQQVLDRAVETIRGLAEQVHALSGAIAESAQRSRHIGDIVAALRELAEQTNLVALNASIEAMNAGDGGRGFSVVATEMGNLAEQSKSSAGEVRSILAEIEKGTRAAMATAEEGARRARGAMDLAAEAARAISGLTQAIRDSSLAARQIANNTRQQGIGVEQIVAALSDLSSASEEVLSGTEAIERTTAKLSALAGALSGAAGRGGAEERA